MEEPHDASESCPTKLISDLPAESDAFGGAHSRVALAMADMFRSDPGGKTIGLEGGWGSGKSTVVRLFRNQLESSKDISVALFDAWSHQGDPLRRTFLETLITNLTNREWIGKEKWTARVEELARRRKVTETKNIPRLTALGNWFSLSLLMIPIGAAVLGVGLDQSSLLRVTIGVLLTLAPALLVFGRLLVVGKDVTEDEGLALISSRAVTESRTEHIESPDPTSVEFAQTFQEVLDEALEQTNHRLVIVIDNLDRVDPSDALSIWATLQTFFQLGEHSQPAWFQRLWILIPYDPTGIRRLWQANQEAENHGETDIALSSLDKTFQTRFQVPPPVLSNWRTYLEDNLAEALGRHNPQEFADVVRLFGLFHTKVGKTPTPREIKLFVNALGTVHRQWQHTFRLVDAAYFVSLMTVKAPSEIAAQLVSGKIPDPVFAGLLSAEVTNSLAALHFNVEPELAQELLLGGPILSALQGGDGAKLASMAQVNGKGFWAVLDTLVLQGDLQAGSAAGLASVARCLNSSRLFESKEREEVRAVLEHMRASSAQIESWSPFTPETAQGIAAILQLIEPDDALLDEVIERVSKSQIQAEANAAPLAVEPTVWAQALGELVAATPAPVSERLMVRKLAVPATEENWVTFCTTLAQEERTRDWWPLLHPAEPIDQVSRHLAGTASAGSFETRHADTVLVTTAEPTSPGNWGELITQVTQRLQQVTNTIESVELISLLRSLWLLRSTHPEANTYLGGLVSQGQIFHHLHEAASRSSVDGQVWCLFTALYENPGNPPPADIGNSRTGHALVERTLAGSAASEQIIEEFVSLAAKFGKLDIIFQLLDQNQSSTPFVSACVTQAAKQAYAASLFTPDVVVKRWEFLRSSFGELGFDQLVLRIASETNLVQQIMAEPFDAARADMYTKVIQIGASDAFISFCQGGLGSVSKDTWIQQLQSEGQLIDLLLILVEKGYAVHLELPFQDALAERADGIAHGNAPPSRFIDKWQMFYQPLDESAQTALKTHLYDIAVEMRGGVAPAFFRMYGRDLGDLDYRRRHRDVVRRLFSSLVDTRSTQGLAWVATLLQETPSFLDDFEPADVEDFRRRVRGALEPPSDEPWTEALTRIAGVLGIGLSATSPGDPQPEHAEPD